MELNDYEVAHSELIRNNSAECTLFLKRNSDFPLAGPCEVALYGSGARQTVKGGTGSGEVNSRYSFSVEAGLLEAGFTVTTSDWLDEYDRIHVQAHDEFVAQVKKDALKKHKLAVFEGMGKIVPEPDYALPLKGAGEVGIYVLARISGEGNDRTPTKGDVMLTPTEIRDILAANAMYDKFMLVLNVGGPVDLTPVASVENILLLSQLGVETGHIFADILLGKSNPTGKLTTTWAKWEDYPQIGDFGDRNETRYREGIYVGYRYFTSVDKKPAFPFGFGLSYTEFEIGATEVTVAEDEVQLITSVKNTGKFVGKEVVQVYITTPTGLLDHPKKELASFAKSVSLEPAQEASVESKFRLRDMASYDAKNHRWFLEKGEYLVWAGNSSEDCKPVCVLTSDEVTVRVVRNCFGEADFEDYAPETEGVASPDVDTSELPRYAISGIPTEEVSYDVSEPIAYAVKELSDEQLCQLHIGEYGEGSSLASVIGEASKHVAGAAGESTNKLADQDFPVLIMSDGPAGLRLCKDYVVDAEGIAHGVGETIPDFISDYLPKPLLTLMKLMAGKDPEGEVQHQYCSAIPIGTAVAQSFNIDLIYRYGDIIGDEMERFNVDLWLAPALNIHRSILCGRNFEYYSEDPVISGKVAAAITNGVQSHKGRYVTIKHYAVNNQETNRYFSNSIVSERTLREIYLKGFGITMKESKPITVMTSYNLLNGQHTSERKDLIEDVLRAEFGFDGLVMTDWVVASMKKDSKCLYDVPVAWKVAEAGNEIFMPGSKANYKELLKGLKKGNIARERLEETGSRIYRVLHEIKG